MIKICSKCKKEFPLTSKYFYRRSDRTIGFRSWCKKCEKIKDRNKYLKNRETNLKKAKKYRQSEKGKEVQRIASIKREKKYKISRGMARSIRASLKGNKNGHHWEDLVEFTLKEFKQHLESLFLPGMMWDNHGEWHIDHIIPISSFTITNYECEDFKECWSLENLQPLWAEDNLRKRNKILN